MIVVKNTHEAIVSQELWDRVREMEQSVSDIVNTTLHIFFKNLSLLKMMIFALSSATFKVLNSEMTVDEAVGAFVP